jgi:hypothetical protein
LELSLNRIGTLPLTNFSRMSRRLIIASPMVLLSIYALEDHLVASGEKING